VIRGRLMDDLLQVMDNNLIQKQNKRRIVNIGNMKSLTRNDIDY